MPRGSPVGSPPRWPQKVFEMSSRRLVFTIKLGTPIFEVVLAPGQGPPHEPLMRYYSDHTQMHCYYCEFTHRCTATNANSHTHALPHFTWYAKAGVLEVSHFTWYAKAGVLIVPHFTWYAKAGVLEVSHFTWYAKAGVLEVSHFMWYAKASV